MSSLTDREYIQMLNGRHDFRMPADERREQTQQLQAHVFDGGEALKFQRALESAGAANPMNFLRDVQKSVVLTQAGQSAMGHKPGDGAQQLLKNDPLLTWTEVPGTIPRYARVPVGLLRMMADQDPIIQAILQITKNRLSRHSKHVANGVQALIEGSEGYDVMATFKPPHEPLTESELREKMEIVNFIANSGDAARFTLGRGPNREDYRRESFSQMLAHLTNQRFILDAVAVEIQRSRNRKRLSGLYVADGGTIAKVDERMWPYGAVPEAGLDPKAAFVQVWRNQIVAVIGSEDMYYDYANPRDAFGFRGYGMSETEMSIKLTTGIMNILNSNNAIFDRGALPPGILYFMGAINSNDMTGFQQEWDAYRLGAGGQHGLPALSIRDPQGKVGYLRTDGQPNEMQFSAYINFLAAIRCAIFGMDVTEVNVSSFGGNNSGLSSGKDTQTRIDESKNRGFLPFVNRIENMYNEIIGPVYNGRWRFSFVGLGKENPKDLKEQFMKVATVDESRAVLFGMPPLGGMVGQSLASNSAVSQMALAAISKGAVDSDGDGALSIKEVAASADKKEKPPTK